LRVALDGDADRVLRDRHSGHRMGDIGRMRAIVYEHSLHVVCPFWQHVVMYADISRHTGHWSAFRTESDTDWMSSAISRDGTAAADLCGGRADDDDDAASAAL
jgi:hypothetical protein